MSPRIREEATVYRQILGLFGLIAIVTVGGCLGLLWMRQQIEQTADATRALEKDILKEEQRLQYLDTKIAEVHQPQSLQRQIARLDLDLAPPRETQVVYMRLSPARERALAQQAATQPTTPRRDPFRYSIDLAVMDALGPKD